MKVLKDAFPRLQRWIMRVQERKVDKEYEAAVEGLDVLMDTVREFQPIGQLDPLVIGGWATNPNRHERPSIRQGLVPIEFGWHYEAERTDRGAEMHISSESEHISLFTYWTGRSYLGIRPGAAQVASNPPRTLAFWSGGPRFPRSTAPHGFEVETDFMQDAFDSSRRDMRRSARRKLRELLVEVRL